MSVSIEIMIVDHFEGLQPFKISFQIISFCIFEVLLICIKQLY